MRIQGVSSLLVLVVLTPTTVAIEARKASAFASPPLLLPTLESPPKQLHKDSTFSSIVSTSTRGGGKKVETLSSSDDEDVLFKNLLSRLKIASYFAVWYALNIVYNIINKRVLNVLPAPLTVGSIQFGIGALYASLVWMLKMRTRPTTYSQQQVTHIGFHHAVGQLLSMVSLGAGPVSFTHIVKALEPFFSALVSALIYKKCMAPQVYATLLPVVGGVGYACLKEKAFSWLAFSCAMGSNVSFALRAVLSKNAMSSDSQMSAANLFGLVTWAAWLISIPIALLGEGSTFANLWKSACRQVGQTTLIQQVTLSGLFHYLNNEVMYLALSNVHPVTLAVGNTMKRVFIMVASVLVFRNPVSLQAGIGSAIGISGVLLYSLTKQHYEQLAAMQETMNKNNKKRARNKQHKIKKKRQ